MACTNRRPVGPEAFVLSDGAFQAPVGFQGSTRIGGVTRGVAPGYLMRPFQGRSRAAAFRAICDVLRLRNSDG